MPLTIDQCKRMMVLIYQMEEIAAPIGSMHAYWDVIMDMHAFIQGRPTIVQMTADEWIQYATEMLDKHHSINNQ